MIHKKSSTSHSAAVSQCIVLNEPLSSIGEGISAYMYHTSLCLCKFNALKHVYKGYDHLANKD